MTSPLLSLPRTTHEYLEATIGPANVTLDTETVELSLTHGDADHAWLPATWLGEPGTTRVARTTSPVDLSSYDEEQYGLYVRVTATPETPVIYVGRVRIY